MVSRKPTSKTSRKPTSKSKRAENAGAALLMSTLEAPSYVPMNLPNRATIYVKAAPERKFDSLMTPESSLLIDPDALKDGVLATRSGKQLFDFGESPDAMPMAPFAHFGERLLPQSFVFGRRFEELPKDLAQDFSQVTDAIEGIAQSITKVWDHVKPQKATVEFGLQIEVSSGGVVKIALDAKGTAHITVTLEWDQPVPGPQKPTA